MQEAVVDRCWISAVEKLHTVGVMCHSDIRMKWMALALQIERRNALLNEQCRKLTEQYGHDGLATCILKGQGNCLNYPEELQKRRQCGDIDIWVAPLPPSGGCCNGADKDAVIEYVRMRHRLVGNDVKPVIRYHHIEAPKMAGTEVEVHFRPCYVHSPLRNCRLQRWFDGYAGVCMKNKAQMGFAVPTSSVNVVYQMCHLFSHYFDEGLGLRQLMDYYFTLRVWHNDVMECKDLQSQGMWSEGMGSPVMSASEIMAVLRSFGMGKFAGAVMYVLHEVFVGGNENDNENGDCPQMNTDGHGCPQADGDGEQQLPASGQQLSKKYYAPWMICEPNEVEGRRMLAEIMQGGNFGQYDTRDAALKNGGMVKHGVWKLKRVMRLVRSYPEEAMWEPVFRVWHLLWRGING